ncbi:cation transporter [Aestuariirhabdus sp. LZHN29]|uniref:cation transporter n=1 Tax=Aestuariirhabdus sp. LZHN29 TaxID=3417462 RepID=UPI003CF531D7
MNPQFRRVLWFALASNGMMFIVELGASFYSGSISLQADALDFFGDSINYGLSLLVLGMSLQVRAKAALFKGATMALFGCWVIGSAIYRIGSEKVPDPEIMGVIGLMALAVNVLVAVMLFRYRSGDSNMRSIWLCSRNDALANIAVMGAAVGVFTTASGWPDLVVAAVIAGLNVSAAIQVVRQAQLELKQSQGIGDLNESGSS